MESKEELLPPPSESDLTSDISGAADSTSEISFSSGSISPPEVQSAGDQLPQQNLPSKWLLKSDIFIQDMHRLRSIWPQLFTPENQRVFSAVLTYYHTHDKPENKFDLIEKIHAVYPQDYEALYILVLCAIKLYFWCIDEILVALRTSQINYIREKIKILFSRINSQGEDPAAYAKLVRAIREDHTMVLGELKSQIAISNYCAISKEERNAVENEVLRIISAELLRAFNFQTDFVKSSRFLRHLEKHFIGPFTQSDADTKKLIRCLFKEKSLPPHERFFSTLFQPKNALLIHALLKYAIVVGYQQAEQFFELFGVQSERYQCSRCVFLSQGLLRNLLDNYDAKTVATVVTHIDSLKELPEGDSRCYVEALFPCVKLADQEKYINLLLRNVEIIAGGLKAQVRNKYLICPLIRMIQKYGIAFTSARMAELIPLQHEMYERIKILDYICANGAEGLSEFVSAMRFFEVTMQLLVDVKPPYAASVWLVDRLLSSGFREAAALLEIMPEYFVSKKSAAQSEDEETLEKKSEAACEENEYRGTHHIHYELYDEFVFHIWSAYYYHGLSGISELKKILEDIEQQERFWDYERCKKVLLILCVHMRVKGFVDISASYIQYINNSQLVVLSKGKKVGEEVELQPLSDSLSSAQLVSSAGIFGKMKANIVLPASQLNSIEQKKRNALRFICEDHWLELTRLIKRYESEVMGEYFDAVKSSSQKDALPYVYPDNTLKSAKLYFLQHLKNELEVNVNDTLSDIVLIIQTKTQRQYQYDNIEDGFFSGRCKGFIQSILKDPSAIATPSL